MAIVFELVAYFGADLKAAQDFSKHISEKSFEIQVEEHTIGIHRPILNRIQEKGGDAYQVSIIPKRVGYAVSLDQQLPRIPLTSSELSELGNNLYDLIRDAPGYQIAVVGWDIEHLASYQELKNEWSEELAEGVLDGLVLSSELKSVLPGANHFEPFDSKHFWIPYGGTRTLE